ncbi:MAG: response regulator [bacterium]|nr:response regulator [bacterium]
MMAFSIIPRDDARQALRMRRALLALVMGFIHFGFCWACSFQGLFRLSRPGFVIFWVTMWTVHLAFLITIRSGLNKRFSDPSLTLPLMTWAATCLGITIYYLDELRPVLLMLFLISIIFGSFRLRRREFAFISLYTIAFYGIVIILLHRNHSEVIDLSKELVAFVSFGLAISCFSLLGSEVSEMRYRLRKQNDQLRAEIAERKRAEKEKLRLESQLHRAQRMEAVGNLAGGVAHDLNNVLCGLVGVPDLLLLSLPEDSPLINSVVTIKRSGEKAAAIVQDLLTLGRRGVATMEVVNLNRIVSDYLDSQEWESLRRDHPGVRVSSFLDPSLLNLLGSSVHLSNAVMNLVAHAAGSMPGGGEIRISTRNEYVDRPTDGYDEVEEGDYVTLSVSDEGAGIPAEYVERIFEPFFTKRIMGRSGSGLGMAVVWGAVKDHGGYIDVQSLEGRGATIKLYFPATRRELSMDHAGLSLEDLAGSGESILIVDDVEEQRETAAQMLKMLGYSVVTVASGEEAVEYMARHDVDLLVLDMIMDPGIDGLETYRRIVQMHPGQKAIITSGFSETERVKAARELGAGQYVKKPYDLERIGLAIRRELGKAAASGT